MSVLAFIPFPLPEESPSSLLKRAAHRNGYRSINQFLAYHFNYPQTRINLFRRDSDIARYLCEQAGEHAETVKNGFYQSSHKVLTRPNLVINGIEIKKTLLRYNEAAICSECIKEGWDKYIKDIRLALNCPYHYRRYLLFCPSCKRKFTWKNQTTIECKCKAKLNSPSCTEGEVWAEVQLLRLMRSQSQASMDLLSDSLSHLGFNSSNGNPNTNRIIFTTAIAIVFNDTNKIINGLISLSTQETTDINLILSKLSPLTPKHLISTVSNKLPTYTRAKHPVAPLPFSLSRTQLQNYLIIPNSEWNKIRKHPLFPKKESRLYSFSPQDINTIKTIQKLIREEPNNPPCRKVPKSLINMTIASNILNVSTAVLRELIHSNLLGKYYKYPKGPKLLSAQHVRSFKKDYICVQALSNKTKKSIQSIKKAIAKLSIKVVPLRPNSKYTAVISNSDADRITQELSSPSPLTESKTRHKRSANLPFLNPNERSEYYCPKEIRKLTGLELSTIRAMIRSRILISTFKSKFGTYLVHKNEVENFHKEYITISELSRILQTPRNMTTSILMSHGVSAQRAEKTTLFLRKDIPLELVSSTKVKPANSTHSHMERNSFSIAEVCRLTGATRRSINDLLQKTILPLRPTPDQGQIEISSSELQAIQKHIRQSILLSSILDHYQISSQSFSRLFFLGNYLERLTIHKEIYISLRDQRRATNILERFCTCKQADILLNAPTGFARNLLKCGKIQPARVPAGVHSSPTLLSREQILKIVEEKNGPT
ncbi:TniQ family protein [Metapseudomonas resinovorans]|uniref:TniQ family protein n=1 Tax=Metapseudomonas resinovorans TaxID=53412 RepID=UPI0004071950|nr:TniQ family protein [Pseudomonas resinovorans]